MCFPCYLADARLFHAAQFETLEQLKARFGESQLHACAVMIKDINDSKRNNSKIQEAHARAHAPPPPPPTAAELAALKQRKEKADRERQEREDKKRGGKAGGKEEKKAAPVAALVPPFTSPSGAAPATPASAARAAGAAGAAGAGGAAAAAASASKDNSGVAAMSLDLLEVKQTPVLSTPASAADGAAASAASRGAGADARPDLPAMPPPLLFTPVPAKEEKGKQERKEEKGKKQEEPKKKEEESKCVVSVSGLGLGGGPGGVSLKVLEASAISHEYWPAAAAEQFTLPAPLLRIMEDYTHHYQQLFPTRALHFKPNLGTLGPLRS